MWHFLEDPFLVDPIQHIARCLVQAVSLCAVDRKNL
jgi:hypothetical protein